MNAVTDTTPAALVYAGVTIRDRGEMLSLTDMWRAAGSPENREPFNWARFEGRAFIEAVAVTQNLSEAQVLTTKRGKNGGTFAHWQIGLAYAKYLAPEFHMWCNEVVRAHMEGAPAFPAGRVTDLSADVRSAIGGIMKGIFRREMIEIRQELLMALIADGTVMIRQGKTAKAIWDAHGLPPRLRGSTVWLGNRLAEMSCLVQEGLRAEHRSGSIRLFDPDKAAICMKNGLLHRARVYASERMGQLRLKLIPRSEAPE